MYDPFLKRQETPRIQRLRAHSPIGRESLPDFHLDPVVEWVPHEPFEKLWTVFEELKISQRCLWLSCVRGRE